MIESRHRLSQMSCICVLFSLSGIMQALWCTCRNVCDVLSSVLPLNLMISEKRDALLKIWQSSPTHCLLSIYLYSIILSAWADVLSVPARIILNIKHYWHSQNPRTTVMNHMSFHFCFILYDTSSIYAYFFSLRAVLKILFKLLEQTSEDPSWEKNENILGNGD